MTVKCSIATTKHTNRYMYMYIHVYNRLSISQSCDPVNRSCDSHRVPQQFLAVSEEGLEQQGWSRG